MIPTDKATFLNVTQPFLDARAKWQEDNGFQRAKWIGFCEAMIAQGYTVTLYEARHTFSKYIAVYNLGMKFRVRFSNHRPHRDREAAHDCDYFVGIRNDGSASRTEDAIAATIRALGPSPFAKSHR